MEKLNKVFSESVSQSVVNDTINENLSNGFKKFINKAGLTVVVGALALSAAGMAHADNSNNVYAAGAAIGLLTNGVKPPMPVACRNVQGISGTQVGAAMAVGGLASSKKALIGGLLGAAVLAKEVNRMENECNMQLEQVRELQQNAQYNNNGDYAYNNNGGSDYSFQNGARPRQVQNYQQNNNYQNTNHNNNGYNNGGVARYNDSTNMPTETILYQAIDNQGRQLFITPSVSPGMRGLMGIERGERDINSDPNAKATIEGSLNKLNNDYIELDKIGKEYLQLTRGNDNSDLFITNYEDAQRQAGAKKNTTISRLKSIASRLKEKFDNYAVSRGMVARNLDAATATAHFEVSQYSNYQQLFDAPQSTKITYRELNNGQELPNRYPTGLPAVNRR